MNEQIKMTGASAIIIYLVLAILTEIFEMQVRFEMYGPFDPILELIKSVPLTAFAIIGIVSLLVVYDRVTGF